MGRWRLTKRVPRFLLAAVILAALGTGTALAAAEAGTQGAADVPIGQPITGSITYYNNAGLDACGNSIDASSQYLVAVSMHWWTTANPNDDPICQGISVQVTYNGKTITLPVEDECASCDADHIDLSQPAFAELAPLSVGLVNGVTWKFVDSGGTAAAPAASAESVSAAAIPGQSAGSASASPSPSSSASGSASASASASPSASASGSASAAPSPSASGSAPVNADQITGLDGLCVDVQGANTANWTPVQVFACNGTDAQQWTVAGDGTLQALGECMGVHHGDTANGTTVDLYQCNNTGGQVWQPLSDGSLFNPQSGKCLDDTNSSTTPGTQLQIWSCTDAANQHWTLPNG
jgi:hypothetical protein